ncbi:MAG: hypothetical protein WC500_03140 [Candidatus Margulisiibacteriota bacterium]
MTTNQPIGTQVGNSADKYYGAMYRNPASDSLAAREASELRSGDSTRETGFNWDKDSQGDANLKTGVADSLVLSTSTVSRTTVSQPVVSTRGAQEKLQQFKDQLTSKLLQSYEEVFRNTFHWNLPLANMAKWSIDNIFNRLTILGVEQGQLQQVRQDVTVAMRSENRGNMRQVVETEAYQEVGIA